GLADAATAAKKLAEHFREIPDVLEGLSRLYGRLGWKAERAVVLRDLAKRFPQNQRVLTQVLEVLEEQGDHLEADAVADRIKKPQDSGARLGLADARYAAGDHLALRHALADAILAGGEGQELAGAVELVEGMTELEPYRQNGSRVIKEYEASGKEMDGTAARV